MGKIGRRRKNIIRDAHCLELLVKITDRIHTNRYVCIDRCVFHPLQRLNCP